jgi:hypothetical protein
VTGPAFGINDPCTSVGAIVTRPTQATSVCTVRPNHVLIEMGYQNIAAGSGGTTVAYPQTLVRIGTALPALEVDVAPPGYERLSGPGATSGIGDTGAGLKYVFGYSPRFNYGANVFFTAPTGSNGISAGGPTQTYNFNYGYILNSTYSLAGTMSMVSLPNGAGRYTSFEPALFLSAALPNASGLFLEGAEFTNAVGPGTQPRTQLMAGVTRDVASRLQFDVEYGHSIGSGFGSSNFIGIGASYYR